MASRKEYLDFYLGQLSGVPEIAHRAMMGEYIIYCRGKVIGGIYDDRFLIKPTASARALMPDAPFELPYEGAKEMLLIENVDDREFLARLINFVADESPEPKKKKK
ncbi:TfoX/Sxy family protein [Ruminococcus sp. NK3A76]|uniref:TfoX/Sxy family protein n=1 Tax=Ruminococcus sp. NK3A76 TaxID=877411 RepID=UPI0004910D78|nr:TfoX/Sxy family protein [Ruminococcus sp. NK3A76]